jgi:cell division protein FtsB
LAEPVWVRLGQVGSEHIVRRILLLVVVLAGLGVVVLYLPGLSKYMKLRQQEKDLAVEILRLKTQIASLKEEETLIKTDLTKLEEVIREQLGLVKPGEIIYKVVEEEVERLPSVGQPGR